MAILNASMRTNLLSLQSTQKLMDATQQRLSTGLKVNSAIDNPNAYFTASNLNNRASDLNSLLDSMGQAVQTVKAADEGIKSITTLVQQAKSLANTALADKTRGPVTNEAARTTSIDVASGFDASTAPASFEVDGNAVTVTYATGASKADVAAAMNTAMSGLGVTATYNSAEDEIVLTNTSSEARAITGSVAGVSMAANLAAPVYGPSAAKTSAQSSFNDLLVQIDQLANDANYKGVNLLTGDSLEVIFNEDRSSSVNIAGVSANSTGLALETADFTSGDAGINAAIKQTEAAINTLRTMSSDFSNAYSIVQNREEFTENLVNVLTEGAGKLVDADMNEEAANMLALQTRQQLGVNALSLASQSAQSVLKLF